MWFLLILFIFLFGFLWLKKYFLYFEKIGFPFVPGKFPMGSTGGVGISEHTSVFMKRNYDKFKNESPAFGLFIMTKKVIVPTDPKLVKEILIRNFESFHERGFYINEKTDPLSNNLFFTSGQHWKDLRAKLSPTFTSGRMKMMFPIVESKADRMIEFLKSQIGVKKTIDLKEVFASYTIESIASVAFGIEAECLGNPENEFRKAGKMVSEPSGYENMRLTFAFVFEGLAKLFNMKFNPDEVTNFFMGAVKETFDYREKNKIERNDFFQLAMNLMKTDENFSFEELAANCFIFFFAGFETSSSVSTFMTYELALNEEIQERLRDEINEVLERFNSEVTYDAIMDMKYLDMVFNETLRRWPVVDSQFRKSTRDFAIPNSNLVIPGGTFLLIPTVGLHNDERFWDEPEKFDPERFNAENVKKIVPFSYIPFSEGPRICIGQRFGVMQTKIGIVKLLTNYKLSTCSKTVIPMKLKPAAAFQNPLDGMWLKLGKIE